MKSKLGQSVAAWITHEHYALVVQKGPNGNLGPKDRFGINGAARCAQKFDDFNDCE